VPVSAEHALNGVVGPLPAYVERFYGGAIFVRRHGPALVLQVLQELTFFGWEFGGGVPDDRVVRLWRPEVLSPARMLNRQVNALREVYDV